MKLTISPKKITYWLFVIVVALNLFGFMARGIERLLGYNNTEFVRLFDVSEEANITAWFSSLLLLISAALLSVIAMAKSASAKPYSRHWGFLSLIFLYLSLDEAAKIHEITIKPLRALFNASGLFYYAWVIIAIPFILLLGFVFMRFVFDLPSRTRTQFVLAGVIFLTGALGFEMLGGYFLDKLVGGLSINPILVTFEEFFENFGIVIFISALLTYMKSHSDTKDISFELT